MIALACKTPPRPHPMDPAELLHRLSQMHRPPHVVAQGRCLTELGGVDMNLALDLRADDRGNARMELDYPFGGRAMTLILDADGRLFGEAGNSALILFTPDASDLVHRMVGSWADTSLLVDLLMGRVPEGFGGEVTWEKLDDSRVLALPLENGGRALVSVQRRPMVMDRLVVVDDSQDVIATASWTGWTEVGGYWFPGDIVVEMPGSLGTVSVSLREIDTATPTGPETYRFATPKNGYRSFEDLL